MGGFDWGYNLQPYLYYMIYSPNSDWQGPILKEPTTIPKTESE